MPMPSPAISCKAETLAIVLLLAAAPAPGQVVQVRETAPRSFGYQLGDLVERHAEFSLPPGLRLDAASLPLPRPGAAVELREARWLPPPWWRPGGSYQLRLHYQVLRSPTAPALFEMPPVLLRFEGGTRPQEVRLDGVPILVSPLVPDPPPERRGLGPMQPDSPPPPIAMRPLRERLAIEAGAAVALLLGLLWRRLGWPRRRHPEPFDDAWRAVRRLPEPADAAAWRQALTALHRALDRSAGERLFAPGLDRFLARRPALAPLRPELERFFEHSHRTFFAPGGDERADVGWLKALCRRARDLESAQGRKP